MATKKKALGKGLSALLSSNETETADAVANDPAVLGAIAELPVSSIETNPFQPRTHFEEDALNELADSIRQHGVIQPITVRKTGTNQFQLISGERRFRASQLAGLDAVPAYIRIANDQTMLEMALVENIQREDLDAIEVAISYQRLIDEVNLTQEELADKVAKKRATVTNYLRLLKLPPTIQKGIRDKQITMGHARALINVDTEQKQNEIFHHVVENGLSVRQTEELARGAKANPQTKTRKKAGALAKADLSFEQQKHQVDLTRVLESKLEIKKDDSGKGKILISFNNDDDLTRILNILNP
tara:strand:- start:5387 stop:6289 length:903 start_codon:yes stop_codon:yes gene_type:complete